MYNFNKIIKIIKKNLNSEQVAKTSYFTGPLEERVHFEVIWNTKKYSDEKQIFFVRIGTIIFIDDKLKKKLSGEIYNYENIIYLKDFDSTLGDTSLIYYTALTVYALQSINLSGKLVLDLGSADGILSLVANKKGAKVIAVDILPEMKNKLKNHIMVNNMNPSDFIFVTADIIDKGILSRKIPGDKVDIVVANLGPHYEDADLSAISLLDYLPSSRIFIGGGYTTTSTKKIKNIFAPDEAIDLLKRKGFTITGTVKENTNEPLQRLTFIAEKLTK
mgnify:CR=1 FL=1